MIWRFCISVLALAISITPAEACRVPNDPEAALLQRQRQHNETAAQADVIVKGRLFKAPDQCDPSRHCGDWIESIQVRKGLAATYYLIDSSEFLIACSREFVKPGKVGTFHLQTNGNGMYLILDDIK